MKTTFNLDDSLMTRLREAARLRSTTMTDLVDTALRMLLDADEGPRPQMEPLPAFNLGLPRVDVSNRVALHDLMDAG